MRALGRRPNPTDVPDARFARLDVGEWLRAHPAPDARPPRPSDASAVHVPRWLPRVLFHGTRGGLAYLLREGFALEPAAAIRFACHIWGDLTPPRPDRAYHWAIPAWSWLQALSRQGRRRVEAAVGREILTADDLGASVSLLFTTTDPSVAVRYGGGEPALALDPRKLPLLGAFRAAISDPGEVVLVLPATGFQGGPEAVRYLVR